MRKKTRTRRKKVFGGKKWEAVIVRALSRDVRRSEKGLRTRRQKATASIREYRYS